MGWYMVMSGLVNDPHVSQYRLTAHLGLAIVIFAAMFWVALGILSPKADNPDTDEKIRPLYKFSAGLAGLIFIMILSGGFVAGIRAGFAYNTFPLIDQWYFFIALLIDKSPFIVLFYCSHSIRKITAIIVL